MTNKEFILNRFLTEKVAIAVRTSEEWDKFMCLLEEETNVKWNNDDNPKGFKGWRINGGNYAIGCGYKEKTKLGYASTSFYKKEGYKVIEFQELIKAEERKK